MGPDRRSGRGQRKELIAEIVGAVAADAGVDVLDLPPLADAVDPEALRTLLVGSNASVSVSFDYAGREVVLESGDGVEIRVGRVSC